MTDCADAGIYNKRQIVKEAAEVFDPLGYFSPVLINAKLFRKRSFRKKLFRDLSKNYLEWDEIISPEQIHCWKNNVNFSNLKLPKFTENDQC